MNGASIIRSVQVWHCCATGYNLLTILCELYHEPDILSKKLWAWVCKGWGRQIAPEPL